MMLSSELAKAVFTWDTAGMVCVLAGMVACGVMIGWIIRVCGR